MAISSFEQCLAMKQTDDAVYFALLAGIHPDEVDNNNNISKEEWIKWIHMEPGKAYALNNCEAPHAVSNKSDQARVHLICDFTFLNKGKRSVI